MEVKLWKNEHTTWSRFPNSQSMNSKRWKGTLHMFHIDIDILYTLGPLATEDVIKSSVVPPIIRPVNAYCSPGIGTLIVMYDGWPFRWEMSQHDHMWALLGEVHPHVAQEQPEERQKFGERVKRRETCQVCSLARNATFHGNLCSECEYNMRVVGQRVYRRYDGQREWPSPEIAWLQMQHQNCQDCGKPDHVYIYIS